MCCHKIVKTAANARDKARESQGRFSLKTEDCCDVFGTFRVRQATPREIFSIG